MVRLRFRRAFAWRAGPGFPPIPFRRGDERLATDIIAAAAIAAGAAIPVNEPS